MHDAFALPGFVAVLDGSDAGVATYAISPGSCELVTLNAAVPRRGVGRALVGAVADAAREAGCKRLWLITTNDNTGAQAFYDALGFRQVAIHIGAIETSRQLKPEIPLTGLGGVPILDEIEYEVDL